MAEILDREPDYDFAQFRDWCELTQVRTDDVELEFLMWLYSDANARAHV